MLSLIVIAACTSTAQESNQSEQVSADWQVHSFNQIVEEESELIILATVKSVSQMHEKNSERVVQESVLEVTIPTTDR